MIFGPVGATSFTISSIIVTRTDSDIAEFKKVYCSHTITTGTCRLLEPFCVHTISTTCPRYDPNSPSFFASAGPTLHTLSSHSLSTGDFSRDPTCELDCELACELS